MLGFSISMLLFGLVSLAALLASRACAQSSCVMDVRPAKVPGPASIWPPSIAIVCPVR